ncbi:hypothetical protein EUZ87_05290 [Lactiplantibacillus paraplantarum]|uniref:Uncharacterized protein n=1 Tax=Lactiplantibacillus paraplantarum TaxID=60520 RepID=A0A4Q9Y2E4_9LACO|nr:hypothetical protein EUZ87_05290 [Lactiplantibacillus paraplantarum]
MTQNIDDPHHVNSFWHLESGTWDTRQPHRLLPIATRSDIDIIDVLETIFLLDIKHLACAENTLIFDRQRGLIKTKLTTRQIMMTYVVQLGFSGTQLIKRLASQLGLSMHKLPVIHGAAILMPLGTAKRGTTSWYNRHYLAHIEDQGFMTALIYDGPITVRVDASKRVVTRQLAKAGQLQLAVQEHHRRRAVPNQSSPTVLDADQAMMQSYTDQVLKHYGILALPGEISWLTRQFFGKL